MKKCIDNSNGRCNNEAIKGYNYCVEHISKKLLKHKEKYFIENKCLIGWTIKGPGISKNVLFKSSARKIKDELNNAYLLGLAQGNINK